MAGNEIAEMTGQQPRRDVVAAARPIADDQIDLPALVDSSTALCARAVSARQQANNSVAAV